MSAEYELKYITYVFQSNRYPWLLFSFLLTFFPVMRAKETLSGRRMREKRMKQHIAKIGKLVEESKTSP